MNLKSTSLPPLSLPLPTIHSQDTQFGRSAQSVLLDQRDLVMIEDELLELGQLGERVRINGGQQVVAEIQVGQPLAVFPAVGVGEV